MLHVTSISKPVSVTWNSKHENVLDHVLLYVIWCLNQAVVTWTSGTWFEAVPCSMPHVTNACRTRHGYMKMKHCLKQSHVSCFMSPVSPEPVSVTWNTTHINASDRVPLFHVTNVSKPSRGYMKKQNTVQGLGIRSFSVFLVSFHLPLSCHMCIPSCAVKKIDFSIGKG